MSKILELLLRVRALVASGRFFRRRVVSLAGQLLVLEELDKAIQIYRIGGAIPFDTSQRLTAIFLALGKAGYFDPD